MATQKLNLTRDQFATFLKNHEQIKQFELLFEIVDKVSPSSDTPGIEIQAGNADAAANEALAQIVRLAQDVGINIGNADQKAVQALDSIERIASALELLATAPVIQNNNSVVTDYIDLPEDGPHVTQARRVQWNQDDGTVDIGLYGGSVLQVGQEIMFYAKNTSGSLIPNGTPVMFTGTVGSSGKLTFGLAVADGSVPPEYMMGVTTQDIDDNAFGYVTNFGLVRGFNTTGSPYGETWADGDLLYFDPASPGTWTNVQPSAPNIHVPVAVVINAGAGGSGSIFVRMELNEKLTDLLDVYAPAPANGNLLQYNTVNQRWEASSALVGPYSIDVNSTSPALRITQTGTGAALLIEDSASPDATPFLINDTGALVGGFTSLLPTDASVSPWIQRHGTSADASALGAANWSNANTPSVLAFAKSRGAIGTQAIVNSGDQLMSLLVSGSDGTEFLRAARINFVVDAVPSVGSMPGRIELQTTPEGSATPLTRMVINRLGNIGVNRNPLNSTRMHVGGATIATEIDTRSFRGDGAVSDGNNNSHWSFESRPSVSAGATPLTELRHFTAFPSTFDRSVVSQYGFAVSSSMSGATSNYGFYSDLVAASGAWNLYMAGNAKNYISGNLGIGRNVGGVSTPACNLHLEAPSLDGVSTAAELLRLAWTDSPNFDQLAGAGTKITFYQPSASVQSEVANIQVRKVNGAENNLAASMTLATHDGTTLTDRLRINNLGFTALLAGSFGRAAPVTKVANFALADTENWLIVNNPAANTTMTLPSAGIWPGREVMIKNLSAIYTVISASSNVVPLAGGAAGTAILPAGAGKWATLVSDGTSWIIMQAA